MADYLTNTTDLTTVANAIRTKGGTSDTLTFPDGFAEAIEDLPGGGTARTVTWITDYTVLISGLSSDHITIAVVGDRLVFNFTYTTSSTLNAGWTDIVQLGSGVTVGDAFGDGYAGKYNATSGYYMRPLVLKYDSTTKRISVFCAGENEYIGSGYRYNLQIGVPETKSEPGVEIIPSTADTSVVKDNGGLHLYKLQDLYILDGWCTLQILSGSDREFTKFIDFGSSITGANLSFNVIKIGMYGRGSYEDVFSRNLTLSNNGLNVVLNIYHDSEKILRIRAAFRYPEATT